MTLPSSCAPLTGISRARLPAWALPDGWPTQANGEPLLADLAFRDGRIATLTPTDQPTPGLWDLAGALTLPGLVEPHAHLDKTFTIERCRPAQAGLLPAIHAMHEDRRHWSRADIQRRASTALARAAANGVTHLRSHVDWFTADAPDAWQEIARLDTVGLTLERVALVPLPLFRELAQAEAIARTVANSGERCLLGGFIHSSNWDAAAMENLLYSAARWDLDLDLHIDEELSEVSQGLTWLADHLSRHPFPGHICCSHGCALAAGSDEQAAPILRQLAAHGVTLIALPMTNLLLQDATFGRTPRLLVSDDKKDTGTIEIVAPLSGEIVNIEDVPDVVFAEKIVGDGIAIKPTGNKMVAPVDGTIGKIFETNHAFSIESDSGIELFVHFGIDTVELKGEGFKRIAEEGQRVKVGDPVIEFDLPLLEEKAKSTLTPVVISNMDEIKELIKLSGSVTVGETPVIRIKK